MPKLRLCTLILSLAAIPGVGLGSPVCADEGAEVFSRLEAEAQLKTLVPEEVAAVLFARGPRATGKFLAHLEALDGTEGAAAVWAARMETALADVPTVAAAVLKNAKLGDGDAIRVATISLEILKARGEQSRGEGPFEAVLKAAGARSGAASLGTRVQQVVQKISDEGELGSERLLRLIRASHGSLMRDVLQGAAKALEGDAMAACLNRGTGVDGTILNQLQRAVQLGAPIDGGLVQSHIAPFLDSRKEFERSEAALILGKVGQRAQIQPLIEALQDPSRLVRTSSHSALRDLTGMTIAGNHHRWSIWYAEQLSWWSVEGESLVASLRLIPRRHLVAALTSVATKRLYRGEISVQLVGMLNRSDPDEMCAVLAALGSLRDPEALPYIVELRSHPSHDVRSSAEEAIRSMRQVGIRVSLKPMGSPH